MEIDAKKSTFGSWEWLWFHIWFIMARCYKLSCKMRQLLQNEMVLQNLLVHILLIVLRKWKWTILVKETIWSIPTSKLKWHELNWIEILLNYSNFSSDDPIKSVFKAVARPALDSRYWSFHHGINVLVNRGKYYGKVQLEFQCEI